MTTTYDPTHSLFTDEADVRGELQRVFDVCGQCRRCIDHCSSFPTLFDLLDALEDGDAGRMTPAQQDHVVDQCHQCKLCEVGCPYTPAQHVLAVDVPRLMLRAVAMQRANGHFDSRERVASRFLGRTELIGKLATRFPGAASRIVESAPGSTSRRAFARFTGVSSQRHFAPFARQRFSSWFRQRPKIRMGKKHAVVTVYPTCLVEYRATGVGKDLVKVYERNGIECTVSGAQCCGAPLLHSGDLTRFRTVAAENVAALASEIRAGSSVVVPQPSCGHVIRHDYLDHLGGAEAAFVAENVHDASEYLMRIHAADATVLDTDFDGHVPTTVTYHSASDRPGSAHDRGGRDLLRLTGTSVRSVRVSSGSQSLWALRSAHDDTLAVAADRLGEEVERAGGEIVAGACLLSNQVIAEQTGRVPAHPLQVIARAYGFPEER